MVQVQSDCRKFQSFFKECGKSNKTIGRGFVTCGSVHPTGPLPCSRNFHGCSLKASGISDLVKNLCSLGLWECVQHFHLLYEEMSLWWEKLRGLFELRNSRSLEVGGTEGSSSVCHHPGRHPGGWPLADLGVASPPSELCLSATCQPEATVRQGREGPASAPQVPPEGSSGRGQSGVGVQGPQSAA